MTVFVVLRKLLALIFELLVQKVFPAGHSIVLRACIHSNFAEELLSVKHKHLFLDMNGHWHTQEPCWHTVGTMKID